MRKRELIAKLKADDDELRKSVPMLPSRARMQEAGERRMMILHHIEGLLPEIIEKLES